MTNMSQNLLIAEYNSLRTEIIRNIEEEVKIERMCLLVISVPFITKYITPFDGSNVGNHLFYLFSTVVIFIVCVRLYQKITDVRTHTIIISGYLKEIEREIHGEDLGRGWETRMHRLYHDQGIEINKYQRRGTIVITGAAIFLYLLYVFYGLWMNRDVYLSIP